jgi:uncharacterized protein (TIGR02246 family)
MPGLFCLLCLLVQPLMTSPSPAGAQTQSGRSADWDAAAGVLRELDAAYDGRDAARFSALFEEEASFEFPVEGSKMRGRDEIRRVFAERFQTLAPEIRHVTTLRAVDEIRSGLVAADFEVDIVGADPKTGNTSTSLVHYSRVGVGVRTDSQWHIRLARVYRMTK